MSALGCIADMRSSEIVALTHVGKRPKAAVQIADGMLCASGGFAESGRSHLSTLRNLDHCLNQPDPRRRFGFAMQRIVAAQGQGS